jgi:RNA polymerase sigma factor FliA
VSERAAGVHVVDSPEVLARIESTLPLVDTIAGQLRKQLGDAVMRDELVSFGREGLLAAARSFDPTLGVPFTRWANYRVRGAMLDGVRELGGLPRAVHRRLRGVAAAHHTLEGVAEEEARGRASTPDEADTRLGAYLSGIATAVALGLLATPGDGGEAVDRAPSPEEQLGTSEALKVVREAVAELPEQERHMVTRHYFDDVRLDEAAAELGLSKSWGSRIHARALEAITRHMKRSKATP